MTLSFTDIQQTMTKLAFADADALRKVGLEKLSSVYIAYPVQVSGLSVFILLKRGLSPRRARVLTEPEAADSVLVLAKEGTSWKRAWPQIDIALK